MEILKFSCPQHQLNQYSAFRQNPIFPKDPNMKKYQHYIDVRGDVLSTLRGTTTAFAISKLSEKKTDLSEIERACNIRKQHSITRFYFKSLMKCGELFNEYFCKNKIQLSSMRHQKLLISTFRIVSL